METLLRDCSSDQVFTNLEIIQRMKMWMKKEDDAQEWAEVDCEKERGLWGDEMRQDDGETWWHHSLSPQSPVKQEGWEEKRRQEGEKRRWPSGRRENKLHHKLLPKMERKEKWEKRWEEQEMEIKIIFSSLSPSCSFFLQVDERRRNMTRREGDNEWMLKEASHFFLLLSSEGHDDLYSLSSFSCFLWHQEIPMTSSLINQERNQDDCG